MSEKEKGATPDANTRCVELMGMRMDQWPLGLYSYAQLLSRKLGAAGGTLELACYNYAVVVEGCPGTALQIDDDEKALLTDIYVRGR